MDHYEERFNKVLNSNLMLLINMAEIIVKEHKKVVTEQTVDVVYSRMCRKNVEGKFWSQKNGMDGQTGALLNVDEENVLL